MIEYKKSSAIMVFNDERKLLLQLRSAGDNSFPSHWDFSAGGGIDAGEDERLTAKRELFEEIGVKTNIKFVIAEHYTYPAWNSSAMSEVDLWIYRAHYNGPFKPDLREVEKVEFFTLERIKEMIDAGRNFHPEFVLSWNKGIIANELV